MSMLDPAPTRRPAWELIFVRTPNVINKSIIRVTSILQRYVFGKYENIKQGNQVDIDQKSTRPLCGHFHLKNQIKMWPSYAGALNIQWFEQPPLKTASTRDHDARVESSRFSLTNINLDTWNPKSCLVIISSRTSGIGKKFSALDTWTQKCWIFSNILNDFVRPWVNWEMITRNI